MCWGDGSDWSAMVMVDEDFLAETGTSCETPLKSDLSRYCQMVDGALHCNSA